MMPSCGNFLILNGAPASSSPAPPVSTFLESTSGAYTTTRTFSNATLILFWDRHLRRLVDSTRILANSRPDLIGSPRRLSLAQIRPLVNNSLRSGLGLALNDRIDNELAITALIRGCDDGDRLDVYVHIGFYVPAPFGAAGARLAVAGPGREVAAAKYSDWARVRKGLEKMRPPGATELLLSNDGNRILEGSVTNFFAVCRKGEYFEVQTAPIGDGVLPGIIRQLVIEICSSKGIPLREVAPSWSEHEHWTEAFVTSSLRLLQHVETIEVPLSCKELQMKAWKEVSWSTRRFEVAGIISSQIQVLDTSQKEYKEVKQARRRCSLVKVNLEYSEAKSKREKEEKKGSQRKGRKSRRTNQEQEIYKFSTLPA